MASSLVLKTIHNLLTRSDITFRYPTAFNILTRSGIQFSTNTALSVSHNLRHLNRTIAPFRPSSILCFMRSYAAFYVDVSDDDDCGTVTKSISDMLNSEGIIRLPKIIHCDEGLCVYIDMPGMKSKHVQVYFNYDTVYCEGKLAPNEIRPSYLKNFELPNRPYTNVFLTSHSSRNEENSDCQIQVPEKKYTPSDVKAKMKDGVLHVTFTNVTEDDIKSLYERMSEPSRPL